MNTSIRSTTGIVLATVMMALTPLTASAELTVYIPLGSADGIAVVDALNDQVVSEIPRVSNIHGLAITPDATRLVAGSMMARTVAAPPPKPAGMSQTEHESHHALPASGNELGTDPNTGILYLIDITGQQPVQQIDVPGPVHHNAVTADGLYAVSTHPGEGGISVIDLAQRKLIKSVATGPAPNYVVTARSGDRLYVSNTGNDTVSEVDTSRWIVRRNFPVGAAPEHLVLSLDDSALFVNNTAEGTVSVLDLASGEVVKSYPVGQQPHGIDISDNGKRLFVSSKEDNQLAAIDLESDRIQTLALAPAPYHVTTIRGTGKLYVSSRNEPKVWVIDQQSLAVRGEITIRGEGHEMAIDVR